MACELDHLFSYRSGVRPSLAEDGEKDERLQTDEIGPRGIQSTLNGGAPQECSAPRIVHPRHAKAFSSGVRARLPASATVSTLRLRRLPGCLRPAATLEAGGQLRLKGRR